MRTAARFGCGLCAIAATLGVLATGVPIAAAQTELRAQLVTNELRLPVDLQSTPAYPEYVYIPELNPESGTTGRIFWLNVLTQEHGVFLELPDPVGIGAELGVLAMVWDPDAPQNGYFYVTYASAEPRSIVVRFTASSATSADPLSKRVIITIPHQNRNHLAHWLGFGPEDGYLYFASGDGGPADDVYNRAQTLVGELRGKILRLDPDGDDFPEDDLRNYAIPVSNPFVGIEGDDEIWAYGVRNPWRNTFDPLTGDFYIADVGQYYREEINFEPAGSAGGNNYGWRCWEGTRQRDPSEPCDSPRGVIPILDYPHDGPQPNKCSIIGGIVYRGPDPDLNGRYFYGDFCSAHIWSIRVVDGQATDHRTHTPISAGEGREVNNITSFGRDQLGGMYVLDLWESEVYRIVPVSSVAGDCNANGWADELEGGSGLGTDLDGGPTGSPAMGGERFIANCSSCHKADGSGQFGPNIRNKTRTRIKQMMDETLHPGGVPPDAQNFTERDFANIEAYLSDEGTKARPDGTPDACQTLLDCDGDGVPDGAEFFAGTQHDLDFDGLADECDHLALSPAVSESGVLHASYVTDAGIVVVLDYDVVGQRWLVTQYDGIGDPGALRSESFVDSHDSLSYVAVQSPDALTLVSPDAPATPARDLTAELPGSTPIVRSSTTFTSLDGIQFIAGIDGAGELVVYFQTGQVDAEGRQIWAFSNLYADHLRPQSLPTPAFEGDLVSYVTSWNGLNIAGLDANGVIWSVWWAPTMTLWSASNLSEITGAEPIVGKLTAYVTSWGGINLAGLNASGEVVVSWWVPEFGGNWSKNNLSQQFGHPGLKVGELTSYVTAWGGLNVAGLDSDGNLVVYWWSPGMDDWVVSPLSALIPGAPLPASSVRGLAAPTGMLSVFAFTSDDEDADVIRYYWQPDGQWQVENVSGAAVPR